MKKTESLVREYVYRLSDDDLRQIVIKLSQRIAGDRADCAVIFEKDKDINYWLQSAFNAEEWFDMVDSIYQTAEVELDRRVNLRKKDKLLKADN